jgi:hypothetical protein
MVKIINYHQRENNDSQTFYVLEVVGDVEFVKSQNTGKTYATRKRVFIPTTFNEEACKDLIGQSIEGTIVKEECESYEYTVKETGEVVTLDYRYVFTDEKEQEEPWKNILNADKQHQVKAEIESFSKNGAVKV